MTTHVVPATVLSSSSSLTADFNYYNTTEQPALSEIAAIFGGISSRLRAVRCHVEDIRKHGLQSFNLNRHGFQILQHASGILPPQSSAIPDLQDDVLNRSAYWPELITALKEQLHIRSAAAINTTVRDVPADGKPKEINPDNPRAAKQSLNGFFVCHGDYSPPGGRAHLQAMLPTFFSDNDCLEYISESERAEFHQLRQEIRRAEQAAMAEEGVTDPWEWSGRNYRGPRWAILSVWRPLETVRRDPLGMMDARAFFAESGKKKPCVSYDRVYKARPGFVPEYRSENILPIAPEEGKEHRWWYISEQTPEEVIVLKLYDSDAHVEENNGEVVECVPHSAFALPMQDDKPLRRSVEVRVMAVW